MEVANRAVREFVRRHGSVPWTREDLEELARLRRVWLDAVRVADTELAA